MHINVNLNRNEGKDKSQTKTNEIISPKILVEEQWWNDKLETAVINMNSN